MSLKKRVTFFGDPEEPEEDPPATQPRFLETFGVAPSSLCGKQLLPVAPDDYPEEAQVPCTPYPRPPIPQRRECDPMRMPEGPQLFPRSERVVTAAGMDRNLQHLQAGMSAPPRRNLGVTPLPMAGEDLCRPRMTEQQIYAVIKDIEEFNRQNFEQGGIWMPPLIADDHRLRMLDRENDAVREWKAEQGPPTAPIPGLDLTREVCAGSDQVRFHPQQKFRPAGRVQPEFDVPWPCPQRPPAPQEAWDEWYNRRAPPPLPNNRCHPQAPPGKHFPAGECDDAPPNMSNSPHIDGIQKNEEFNFCPPSTLIPPPSQQGIRRTAVSIPTIFGCNYSPCQDAATLVHGPSAYEARKTLPIVPNVALRGTTSVHHDPGRKNKMANSLYASKSCCLRPNTHYECPYGLRRQILGPIVSGCDASYHGGSSLGVSTLPPDLMTTPTPQRSDDNYRSCKAPNASVAMSAVAASQMAPVLMLDVLRDIQRMNPPPKCGGNSPIIIDLNAVFDEDNHHKQLYKSCVWFPYPSGPPVSSNAENALDFTCPCGTRQQPQRAYVPTGCKEEAEEMRKHIDRELRRVCGCPKKDTKACKEKCKKKCKNKRGGCDGPLWSSTESEE